ncbi:hypothetical protein [Clostridium cadaveris]|uniref:hypothetical protein n=1 Tax=Clostridium cadaveris TaxID=1529 RepID=UPI000C06849A|nr:hypothetical protein [Clostridium cadaveris]
MDEIIELLKKVVELNENNWLNPSVIISILSLVSSTIIAILMYRITKEQKKISKQQQDIQANELKYALYNKRYDIYKMTYVLSKKVELSDRLLSEEYKEKFEECILESKFLFDDELSRVLERLYNFALVRDKVKMVLNKEGKAEELLDESDLKLLKWDITLEKLAKLDEYEVRLSLDERSLAIPLMIREEHRKIFEKYLKITDI